MAQNDVRSPKAWKSVTIVSLIVTYLCVCAFGVTLYLGTTVPTWISDTAIAACALSLMVALPRLIAQARRFI